MKVSIIVPIYNIEHYLNICLDSIVKQSYNNLEVVLVNDGSIDGSLEICREYEIKYPFIRLINKENGGLSDARNTGIRESTGDYLLFLDGDDYWDADFIATLMERVKVNPMLDYVLFRYKKFYQQTGVYKDESYGQQLHKLAGNSGVIFLEAILRENRKFNWYAWQGLIRRTFLLENEFFFQIGQNYEDVLWMPQVLLNARYVEFYDRAVIVYRLEREGQITSNFSLTNLKSSLYVSNFWYQELKKYKLTEELERMLLKNLMTQFFVAIWFAGFLKGQEKEELIALLQQNRNLLIYSNDAVSRFTAMQCWLFGFAASVEIMKKSVAAKRYLRHINRSLKYRIAKRGVLER